MRKVICHDCRTKYDFDVDDFCPKCGAFNQPARTSRIGTDGSVVRVDGLNERNHAKSFVHAELHEENRERRGTALSGGTARKKAAVLRTVQPVPKQQKAGSEPAKLLKKIILAIILFNVLGELLLELL